MAAELAEKNGHKTALIVEADLVPIRPYSCPDAEAQPGAEEAMAHNP